MKIRLLMLLVLSFGGSFQLAFAQQGTMKWRFDSRSEVVPALKKTRGNLRQTYDVLMCAVRQGYSNTALGFYEDVVSGHEFSASAQDSAAYSFAFDLCDGPRPWHWPTDRDYSPVKKSSRVSAYQFRERAMRLGSGSPEILVMIAFRDLYQGDIKARGQSYQRLLRATKRAPRWADAHFWLGMSASSYAMSYETRITRNEVIPENKPRYEQAIKRLGAFALQAYDRAEKLDVGLRRYLYNERLHPCRQAATEKCAQMIPFYVSGHLQAFPQFGEWYKERTGETAAQYRQSWLKTAAKIAQEAKT